MLAEDRPVITHARTAVRHPQPQVKVFRAAETGIVQTRVQNRLPANLFGCFRQKY